jgi:hypothetical protein
LTPKRTFEDTGFRAKNTHRKVLLLIKRPEPEGLTARASIQNNSGGTQ